jgi:hypothetical protein
MQNSHAPGERRKRPLQPEPGTPMWAERAPPEVMCDFCAYPFTDVRPLALRKPWVPRRAAPAPPQRAATRRNARAPAPRRDAQHNARGAYRRV